MCYKAQTLDVCKNKSRGGRKLGVLHTPQGLRLNRFQKQDQREGGGGGGGVAIIADLSSCQELVFPNDEDHTKTE